MLARVRGFERGGFEDKMGRVSIFCMAISTGVLLITFGKGMDVLHGGDVGGHLTWALATLVTVLGANMYAMFHAAQSDRIIRSLRAKLEERDGQQSPH
jgi:hypothetical protein